MHVLIAVQTCFCFLVLFVSGLFVTTFDRLAHQRTGFPVRGLLALDTVTPRDEPPAAWNQVSEHLRSIPGVEDAAVSEWPLLDGNGYRLNHISIEGATAEPAAVRFLVVSAAWIETMKIPLLQGRDFRPDETETAIVNQEFVRKFLPGENPLGKWIEAKPGGAWGHRFQIAGVAADTRYRTMRDPILPVIYIPNQTSWHARTIMVRVSPSKHLANPLALASILRQDVSRARPGFRVTRIRTQQAMLQAQIVREHLLAALALFFSVVAPLLAGVGFYGVLEYSVFQRRREIGICMALGAQTRNIAQRIMSGVIAWVGAGSLMGLLLGLGVARFIGSLLYQVKPTSFGALVTPALAFMAVAVFAALRPVLRAVRTDPARILRSQ
jgi:predicted permease